jgi:hypothetical protein
MKEQCKNCKYSRTVEWHKEILCCVKNSPLSDNKGRVPIFHVSFWCRCKDWDIASQA